MEVVPKRLFTDHSHDVIIEVIQLSQAFESMNFVVESRVFHGDLDESVDAIIEDRNVVGSRAERGPVSGRIRVWLLPV